MNKKTLNLRESESMDWTIINEKVQAWMQEARQLILKRRTQALKIDEKTSRLDLVTNVDCEIESFYTKKIMAAFPNSEIFGEEHGKQHETKQADLLWIIDPIDGTMNFIKQAANYASMIAIYENGHEKLGYILDVAQNKLYWGGPECGVFCNETKLNPPENLALEQGLIGIGGRMLLANYLHVQDACQASLGIRISGSAGMEFINVLSGKTIAYLSHLKPWDYAAGKIMAETLGLVVKTIDGNPLAVLSSSDVLVATKNAQQGILKWLR